MRNQEDREPGDATHLIRTETLHLAEMRVRELIQTPLEERFNRLARVTQSLLGTRVAAISFLDSDGEWFKAVSGWNLSRLPSHRSLAAALVHGPGPLAIRDTLQDERRCSHLLVQGSPRFRFCAMQPLGDRFGNVIGVTSVYETEPTQVDPGLLEAIRDAGELAQRELLVYAMGGIQQKLPEKLDASRREALLDDLTRLWNRRGYMLLLEQVLESVRHDDVPVGTRLVAADDLKLINDRFGHAMGDVVLRNIAAALVSSIRPRDIACRLAGDEFLLVLPNVDAAQLSGITDRLRNRVHAPLICTPGRQRQGHRQRRRSGRRARLRGQPLTSCTLRTRPCTRPSAKRGGLRAWPWRTARLGAMHGLGRETSGLLGARGPRRSPREATGPPQLGSLPGMAAAMLAVSCRWPASRRRTLADSQSQAPAAIRAAEVRNTNGHSLNGRNLIRKPVNSDTIASRTRVTMATA